MADDTPFSGQQNILSLCAHRHHRPGSPAERNIFCLFPGAARLTPRRLCDRQQHDLASATQFLDFLADVDTYQASQIAPENLLFGLPGQMRVAVPGGQIFGDLEVPEGIQGPARVPDRRFAS